MSKSITITYTLYPPSGIAPPQAGPSRPHSVPPADTVSFPLPSASNNGDQITPVAAYYNTTSAVLRQVQNALNELLTPWKDAIGDREKAKEDLGRVGHGQGRAAMLSARVNGEMRQVAGDGDGDESESGSESEQ